jgi:hypothetical protein
VGVLLSRTVNLSHLAGTFPSRAEIASNYRRLQRYFEQVVLDSNQLARAVVRIAGIGSGPWLLALDRTCWKFGRRDLNILMLAIVHNGIAIPVLWDVLDRAGNSTTAHREALLSRFCAAFGARAIAGLIADREFVGTAWMTFLAENDIPFILRIKDAFQIRLADGRCCAVTSLFRKLAVGGRRYLRDDCRLGSRDSALGPPVKLSATRLAHYRRRWQIESLFAATKTRGLNLEDTHITRPDRVAKLIAVLAIAFSFAHAVGECRAKHRPIIIKKHRRRAQSIFRFGFDLLRHILIQGQREAVRCWNAIATARPPTSERCRSSPKPA